MSRTWSVASALSRWCCRPLKRSGFAGATDIRPQRLQFFPDGTCRVALDLAIARDQRGPERGEHCSAAILAAGLAGDRGMTADAVDFLHQIPGSLVGHIHRASRGRD